MKTLNKDRGKTLLPIYLTNYFDQFNRIDQYMRDQKMAQIETIPSCSTRYGFRYRYYLMILHMSPQVMDLQVVELDNHTWDTCINMISQVIVIWSVFQVKALKLAVKEMNTGKYVGFMRFGSPVINM